jgi:hypothetical protein
VHLEISTKPPIDNLIHEFLINMAFTMAYPNFKKSLKMAFGPLGARLSLGLIQTIRHGKYDMLRERGVWAWN